MVKRNLATLLLTFLFEFLVKVDTSFAASVSDNTGGGNGTFVPGFSSSGSPSLADLAIVLLRVFNFLIGIAGAFAIVMIVIGGFRYILSSGDEKALLAAKQTVTFAVAGLVIILLAVTIVNIIGRLFGICGGLTDINIGIINPFTNCR